MRSRPVLAFVQRVNTTMHVCLLLPVIMCLFLPSAIADLGLPHCGVTGRHCMTLALHAARIHH